MTQICIKSMQHYILPFNTSVFFLALYSKAKGQYLRLALPLHALSQPRPLPELIPSEISEVVQKASIYMVSLCIEHTALLAGRKVKEGNVQSALATVSTPTPQSSNERLEQIVLTYPGQHISSTKLNNLSKFRRDGGKQKVLMILNSLENKHLGSISQGKNNVSGRNSKIYLVLPAVFLHLNPRQLITLTNMASFLNTLTMQAKQNQQLHCPKVNFKIIQVLKIFCKIHYQL